MGYSGIGDANGRGRCADYLSRADKVYLARLDDGGLRRCLRDSGLRRWKREELLWSSGCGLPICMAVDDSDRDRPGEICTRVRDAMRLHFTDVPNVMAIHLSTR